MEPVNSVDSSNDERNLAMAIPLATLAALIFSGGLLAFAIPLGAWILLRDRSSLIVEHARAALNFQLTLFLLHVLGWVLIVFTLGLGAVIAVPVLAIAGLIEVLVLLIAATRARRGESYSYPFAMELVK